MDFKYFGAYRVDAAAVEHGCCWGSAVVRDYIGGPLGKGTALVCECDPDIAETICAALNAVLTAGL